MFSPSNAPQNKAINGTKYVTNDANNAVDFFINTLNMTIANAEPNIDKVVIDRKALRLCAFDKGISVTPVEKRKIAAGIPKHVKDVAVINILDTSLSFSFRTLPAMPYINVANTISNP